LKPSRRKVPKARRGKERDNDLSAYRKRDQKFRALQATVGVLMDTTKGLETRVSKLNNAYSALRKNEEGLRKPPREHRKSIAKTVKPPTTTTRALEERISLLTAEIDDARDASRKSSLEMGSLRSAMGHTHGEITM
jgi:chromosome segregation ATPase